MWRNVRPFGSNSGAQKRPFRLLFWVLHSIRRALNSSCNFGSENKTGCFKKKRGTACLFGVYILSKELYMSPEESCHIIRKKKLGLACYFGHGVRVGHRVLACTTHTRTYTHTHTHKHTYTLTYTRAHTRTYIYMYIPTRGCSNDELEGFQSLGEHKCDAFYVAHRGLP